MKAKAREVKKPAVKAPAIEVEAKGRLKIGKLPIARLRDCEGEAPFGLAFFMEITMEK